MKKLFIVYCLWRWLRGVGLGAILLLLAGCVQESPSSGMESADAPPVRGEMSELQVLRYKGRAYLDRGNAVMALNYLREAQKLAPEDGEILAMLGRAYGLSGRYEAALASLKRARELRPQDRDVAYGMGVVLFQVKRYQDAEIFIREALDSADFRERDDAWFHLGLIREAAGNTAEMLKMLDEALKINPVHVPSHLKLASYYKTQGAYERERRHLQEVLAERPEDVAVMEFLAESLLRDRLQDRAVSLMRKIIMLAPDSENAARVTKRLSMLGEVPHESH